MATSVTTRRHGALGWITLDGPGTINAIGTTTYTGITDAITGFERDRDVRAVVIHGAGRGFSAGADIAEISTFSDRSDFARFIHGFTDALDVIERSPLPVVAAVHGVALGGGLELAMACDLRVAAADAKLGLPEAKLGVLPGAGGTQRLPRLIPAGIAREMLMLGTSVTGERGHALGLVNRTCPAADVLAVAAGLAEEAAAGAHRVPSATKELLRRTSTMSVKDGIAHEREVASDLFASPDGREGFRAFVARRAPEFESR
ncbi:enoyl-CoA hydratase-related protein [Nonomuraea wenchangensis]|uniref:enoyl-CoA hydratase/isomerase family protein n=1 Tax=Nonomuraea wenchangensis TaxID=568860 RepID=UPI0034139204